MLLTPHRVNSRQETPPGPQPPILHDLPEQVPLEIQPAKGPRPLVPPPAIEQAPPPEDPEGEEPQGAETHHPA